MHSQERPIETAARDPIPAPPEEPAKAPVEAAPRRRDRVDASGEASFPASDPPSWWAG
jgi:hypothetical protein